MPVPCQTPCNMCGDECNIKINIDDLRHVTLLTQSEAEKFLREHPRSDFDFKMAVMNALVDYRKGVKK